MNRAQKVLHPKSRNVIVGVRHFLATQASCSCAASRGAPTTPACEARSRPSARWSTAECRRTVSTAASSTNKRTRTHRSKSAPEPSPRRAHLFDFSTTSVMRRPPRFASALGLTRETRRFVRRTFAQLWKVAGLWVRLLRHRRRGKRRAGDGSGRA